jgi:hypothetical protein
MGQIFGLGLSGGDKSTSKSQTNYPPEVRDFLRNQTYVAAGGLPQYENILRRGLGGDRSVVEPYAGSVAGAYMPLAGTYRSQEAAFLPGKEAYTAPYAYAMQQGQDQIRRAMPSGGGQQAALAQATMGGAMQMGAARAQQAQRDIDARNALRMKDLMAQMGLGQEDIRTQMGLKVADEQARSQMMQKLFATYAGIFGGFNPMAQGAATQTQTTGGRLGVPFADISLG